MNYDYVGKPFYVGELVVYMDTPEKGRVADFDCRFELNTTANSCDCCTFRFRSRMQPQFICRHIAAVRKVINGEADFAESQE